MMQDHSIFQSSIRLADDLALPYSFPLYDESKRLVISKIFCGIAFEHSSALRLLAFNALYTSAITIVRSQFEALVRATWVLYAATDTQLEKISAEFTPDGEQASKNLPQVNDMLLSIAKVPVAAPLHKSLSEFKEYSWPALNSYVHSGIHAFSRNSTGYPEQLIIQIIKISNALSVTTSTLLALLTGRPELRAQINALLPNYKDCLPLVNVA